MSTNVPGKDIFSLTVRYSRIIGINEADTDTWLKVNKGRFFRPIRDLLLILRDVDVAEQCIREVIAFFKEIGYDCRIGGVVKHAHDWKNKTGQFAKQFVPVKPAATVTDQTLAEAYGSEEKLEFEIQ